MRELTDFDYCDRCMARAKTIATKGDAELLFCGHHGRESFDSLVVQGWVVNDQELVKA